MHALRSGEGSGFTRGIREGQVRSIREGGPLFPRQRRALPAFKHPKHGNRVLCSCPERRSR